MNLFGDLNCFKFIIIEWDGNALNLNLKLTQQKITKLPE